MAPNPRARSGASRAAGRSARALYAAGWPIAISSTFHDRPLPAVRAGQASSTSGSAQTITCRCSRPRGSSAGAPPAHARPPSSPSGRRRILRREISAVCRHEHRLHLVGVKARGKRDLVTTFGATYRVLSPTRSDVVVPRLFGWRSLLVCVASARVRGSLILCKAFNGVDCLRSHRGCTGSCYRSLQLRFWLMSTPGAPLNYSGISS